MKILKKRLFVFLMLVGTAVWAEGEVLELSCPRDATQLSDLFSQHWEKNPVMPWYNSYVALSINGYDFSGSLHTKTEELPYDLNPHLNFVNVELTKVEHYAIWSMRCNYQINNPAMDDLDENVLHFSTSIPMSYRCQMQGNNGVICRVI